MTFNCLAVCEHKICTISIQLEFWVMFRTFFWFSETKANLVLAFFQLLLCHIQWRSWVNEKCEQYLYSRVEAPSHCHELSSWAPVSRVIEHLCHESLSTCVTSHWAPVSRVIAHLCHESLSTCVTTHESVIVTHWAPVSRVWALSCGPSTKCHWHLGDSRLTRDMSLQNTHQHAGKTVY